VLRPDPNGEATFAVNEASKPGLQIGQANMNPTLLLIHPSLLQFQRDPVPFHECFTLYLTVYRTVSGK